jgi:NADH dehydrogenase/NADH:ubiquinone oxidoreductase subunit G
MEKLVRIIADGESLVVSPGTTVLQALRDHGLDIPALCYHSSLEANGSCGLCMVEIWTTDIWEPRHACLLEVEEGLQIKTSTPRLRLLRSWAAQILLRRRPFNNQEIEKLLLKLVKDNAADKQEDDNLAKCIKDLSGNPTEGCILCGLCVRMCRKIGKHRLTFLGRGKNLRISMVPGKGEKDSCGNCRACFHICPTGYIIHDAQQTFKASLYGKTAING